MTQERANFKFTTDFSDKSKLTGDFASMLTEDKMNQYSQELERLNQQYLGRAQTFLSPDQFAAFAISSGPSAGGLRRLFMSHPPLEERIAALRGRSLRLDHFADTD